METKPERNRRQPAVGPAATRVLCDAFILGSWLTIAALFVLRVQWFKLVWELASRGVAMDDLELPTPQGPLWGYQLVPYDQSIFFYLLLSVLFLLLLLFVRNNVGPKAKVLLLTIRILFAYSAVMIISQIVFLALLRLGKERSHYLFNSCLERVGVGTSEKVICIDDPHYVTLVVALLAMGLLASRSFVEFVKKWLASLKGAGGSV